MTLAVLLSLALQDAPFKHENTPENLKQLFETIQKAEAKSALALTNGVLPDEAALRKGLKDDVTPEFVQQSLALWKSRLPAEDAKRAKVFAPDPAKTEVRVYASTTEEILKYEKGSIAFAQFPGGAKKLAESVLRPKMTYYEVVVAKPGAESGVTFHLFYWTGDRWSCLGPIWAAMK